jgi:hypothetical protein
MSTPAARPLDPELDLWERQPEETAVAYEAFTVYRDLGASRSLSKASRQLSKSKPLLQRWSSTWSWVARVDAWDRLNAFEQAEEQRQAIKDMNRRHAAIGSQYLGKLALRLNSVKPEDIPIREIPRFIDAASKLERLARGEAGERTELTGPDGGAVKIEAVVAPVNDPEWMAKLIAAAEEAGIHTGDDLDDDEMGDDGDALT